MSSIDIYLVRNSGNVKKYAEIPNSFHGAPFIWKSLNDRYHLVKSWNEHFVHYALNGPDKTFWDYLVRTKDEYEKKRRQAGKNVTSLGFYDGIDDVIESFLSGKFEQFEDIVLGTSLDDVIVKKSDIPIVIESFEKFHQKYHEGNLHRKEYTRIYEEHFSIYRALGRVMPREVEKAFEEILGERPGNSLSKQAEVLRRILGERNCLGVCWNQTSVNADAWNHSSKKPYNIFREAEGRYWFLFDRIKQKSK